jgi:DNA-binding transcriptional MerR regulator
MKAPDAFRTISEVAEELELPQHVLRFWETRFGQIRPMKRGGGRRYYRPEDVDLLRGIRILLYAEGFTIRGVQRLLKENGVPFVAGVGQTGSVSRGVASAPEELARLEDPDAIDDPDREFGDPDEFAFPPEMLESQPPVSVSPPATPDLATAAAAPVHDPRDAASELNLSADSRRRLETVLADLEEAKQLLDQVR